MQLSIIIVSYNVRYFLEQCLNSVLDATRHISAEIWVVDNASTDDSVVYLRERFPQVNFIENKENVGFAKANNQALKICRGRHVVFLNPDTLVPDQCFEACLDYYSRQEKAGALGVRMVDGGGVFLPESKRAFPDPSTAFYKLSGLSKLFPGSRVFNRYALAFLQEYENHVIDVVAGAFMLCRRDILMSVNGFDEDFFMYGEDIDLSYRIQQAGCRNFYFSGTSIIHFKGESSKKGSKEYLKVFYEAMLIFIKKHYSKGPAALPSFFFKMAIRLRAVIAAVYFFGKRRLARQHDGASSQPRNFLVLGSDNEYREAMQIIGKSGIKLPLVSRVTADEKTDRANILHDIQYHLMRHPAAVVLFCKGMLSWEQVLTLVQKIPLHFSARFHARGSNSIVGSDSRDTSGECIAPS